MADPNNSVSVAAGSLVVSGVLTNFIAAAGDLFIAGGSVAVVARRDSATSLALEQPWLGPSVVASTAWRLLSLGEYWRSNISTNKAALALLTKWQAGPIKWDASGSAAERVNYNNQPRGFAYLVTDPLPFTLYVKKSSANADDWSSGQPLGEGASALYGTLRYDGAQALTTSQRQQARANIGAAGLSALAPKNILVNSDFSITQEWPAGVSTGASAYGADQWLSVTGVAGAVITSQRVANPFPTVPALPYGLLVRTSAAGTPASAEACAVIQRIEAIRARDLLYGTAQPQMLTVFGFVRTNFSGKLGLSFANNGVYVRELSVVADTDTFFRFVFAGRKDIIPLDSFARMSVRIGLAAGSARMSPENIGDSGAPVDAVQTPAGFNMLQAPGLQIILGGICALPGDIEVTAATAPLFLRPPEDEIRLCQRYFAKSYALDIAPGSRTFNGAHRGIVSNNNGRTSLILPLPVAMRVNPSMTIYSLEGTPGYVTNEEANGDTGGNFPATVFGPSQTQGGSVNLTELVAGSPPINALGRSIVAHYTANARP